MPYRVINIYYSLTCYTNHINSTRIQSIASMALTVFPDVALQLGCMGSHSKITHGVHAPVCIGNVTCNTYFDVANIDQYNRILGLPFLRNN